MAITHFTPRLVSRGNGRSVVAAAAYRHCAKMFNEREGRTLDYSRKSGLVHEAFVLPPDAPDWAIRLVAERSVASASEAYWNAVERFEKRGDAQLAKELLMALPIELTAEQNVALVEAFVAQEILPRGLVADWVFHHPQGNPHIHLLTSLRPLTDTGFGAKKLPITNAEGVLTRDGSGRLLYRLWAGDRDDFVQLRQAWLDLVNRHLLVAGHDVQVDGRSYAERGLDIEPTLHLGPAAKAINARDGAAHVARLEHANRQRRRLANQVLRTPGLVIDALSQEHSVFDRRDIARWLHRYFPTDIAGFERAMAASLVHPDLVCLQAESSNSETGGIDPARYSTRHTIALEAAMAERAGRLAEQASHSTAPALVQRVLNEHAKLSSEQRQALLHICEPPSIAAIVGRAGAGKTTMLSAARQIWEGSGYRVIGGALAGKASEGLEIEAGISSRTLASWRLSWGRGQHLPDAKTIFVLDEAGMVGSRQMAELVELVGAAGAKLVMVGDPDQLQPIAAGAAFRALANQIGFAELHTIHRQTTPWMREASMALARGQVKTALVAYRQHGAVLASPTRLEALQALVDHWTATRDTTTSSLILAHRRDDVRALNDMVRASLQQSGELGIGYAFSTTLGQRRFAEGEQIVFLRNDRMLGVKNGMIGQVVTAKPGLLKVAVGEEAHRREIEVAQHLYADLDHGYATTVHKSQGSTVDRVHVLATASLDRHLTYVALTRHRQTLNIFHGAAEFSRAGGFEASLERANTKLSSRDFLNGPDYEAAFRYATNRGLHAIRVAETLLAAQRQWLVQQRIRLREVTARLVARPPFAWLAGDPGPVSEPLFPARTTFSHSVEQIAIDGLKQDAKLQRLALTLRQRLTLIFADPDQAWRRLDPERAITDPAWRNKIEALLHQPERLGALLGQGRFWKKPTQRSLNHNAAANLVACRAELAMFLRFAENILTQLQQTELQRRAALAAPIPALSQAALATLKTWYPIDPVQVSLDRAHPELEREILAFAAAAQQRFGLLPTHADAPRPYPRGGGARGGPGNEPLNNKT